MSTPSINFGLFSAIDVSNSTNSAKTLTKINSDGSSNSDSSFNSSSSSNSNRINSSNSTSIGEAMNSGINANAQYDIITMTTLTKEQPQTTASHSSISVVKPLLPTTMTEMPAKATAITTKLTETCGTAQRPTTPVAERKYGSNKTFCSVGAPMNTQIFKNPAVENEFKETGNATLSNAAFATPSGTSQSSKYESTPPRLATTSTSLANEHQRKTKSLNISFENICYGVKAGFLKREHKQVLNGLSGEFRAGELSAIVGPSGAGKSTLLNILSSYTFYGYSGEIRINGKLRDIKTFKPNVAFLTQDTTLQPFLTVKEAMHFAANLKLGPQVTRSEKREQVLKILKAVGLQDSISTRTGDLSGGQKKRLAISMELVNNPPVLILDEPTSGLDGSTSNQCISLLKTLAMEGLTIICTIHQPSGIAFRMFDHIYAIADGSCIYAGRTENLVPYLAENGLHCPQSYNPCDFLMEIGTNDYGPNNRRLIDKMQNGHNTEYRLAKRASSIPSKQSTLAASLTTAKAPLTPIPKLSSQLCESAGLFSESKPNIKTKSDKRSSKLKKPKMSLDTGRLCKRENVYSTPFYRQISILLMRTFLLIWRDSSLTTLRFLIHFGTALLIGILYYDIGNDASNAINIFRYAFYSIMFIMFCAFSSILTKFPLDVPIVSREHFNRWYSLRAYYIAITLADIPIQFVCTSLFIVPTYYLTGQPLELNRFVLYFFIVFLTALTAQSIGLCVGSALSLAYGAIFGPFFICPFLIFSGFFLQRKDSPIYLTFMFDVSFLKYSLDGSMMALFGYGRDKLECKEIYCHHSHPAFFLRDMDFGNASYQLAAIFLLCLLVILRILAFYVMSFRLRLFR